MFFGICVEGGCLVAYLRVFPVAVCLFLLAIECCCLKLFVVSVWGFSYLVLLVVD